jgi:hypothetical protein
MSEHPDKSANEAPVDHPSPKPDGGARLATEGDGENDGGADAGATIDDVGRGAD